MQVPPQGTPNRRPDRCSRAGFTLVEMLLVLVILATLAAVVVPKFTGRSQQAKETAARSQIASFEMALDAFEVDNGYYPAGGDGLRELIEAPSDAPDWRGPYLKKTTIPLDPWGNEYIYTFPGRQNPDGYDLLSVGADGREGGSDDIANWEDSRTRR